MKQLTLLITALLITTFIFASNNKSKNNRHVRLKVNNSIFTLDCSQTRSATSTGSYSCNGIQYTISVTATATATNNDCSTAGQTASAVATLYSFSTMQSAVTQAANNCPS